MMDNKKRISYEVTDGSGGWTYPTMKQAVAQLAAMSKGFIENKHMSQENREYWKEARTRYHIIKVTEEREQIL